MDKWITTLYTTLFMSNILAIVRVIGVRIAKACCIEIDIVNLILNYCIPESCKLSHIEIGINHVLLKLQLKRCSRIFSFLDPVN